MENNTRTLTPPYRTDDVLTPAETRIAAGYVSGLIGKEIADRAGVSYNTVVKHTQNIYDKVGCRRSTNALVAWWLSVNAAIDLREVERSIGALLLLALLSLQMAFDPSGDSYVRRAPGRRVEARARRGRRREDDNTLDISTI